MDLAEKVKEGIQKKNLSLSSKDVNPNAAADEAQSMMEEDSKVATPPLDVVDPVVAKAAGNDASKALEANPDGAEPLRPTTLSTVVITADDKASFVNAFINNTAWKQSVSLFDGQVKMTMRSRSSQETRAILTRLEKEVREGKIMSAAQYNTRLRDFILAAQVEEFNGIQFDPLKAPYMSQIVDGKEVEPAWLQQVAYWESLQDHVVAVLYREITEFERKYWALIHGANDANFYKTETST